MSGHVLHKNKKEGFLAIGAILVLGGFMTLGHAALYRNSGQQQAVLGASVTAASVTVKLMSIQSYPTNQATQFKRVSLNISVFNNSGRLLQISPGLQMQLVDKAGKAYSVTAAYLPAKTPIGGPLKPSKTWTQAVDFDIASNQIPAAFIYQPDGSATAVRIAL